MYTAQQRLSNTPRNDIGTDAQQQQLSGPVELDLSLLGQVVGGGPVGNWGTQSATTTLSATSGPVGNW